MLGSYMEDIGITAKEFEAACTQGKSITGKFHQQLFEQGPICQIADSGLSILYSEKFPFIGLQEFWILYSLKLLS